MNIQYDFRNCNVVVTGGGQGIGFEIVKEFLQSGAMVTVWEYSESALEHAKGELAQWSERVFFSCVDIREPESCHRAASLLQYPVDILINNAGIIVDRSVKKLSEEDFSSVVQTNLVGAFHVTKSLLEKFNSKGKQKRIINMSSVVALYGNFGQTNYAAAKAGLIGMTKTLAKELGRKGFTVNAIAPGFTLTKMVQSMPEQIRESLAAKVPVGRLARTEDIANAALFLSSEEASYINGITLSVDGGMVLA